MQKLKAFTLTELLIGMLISSIVIGFGYGGYTIIYKQYLDFRGIKKQLVSTMQLDALLNSDFINAEQIQYSENKLLISFAAKMPVQYEFADSILLRTDHEITDTFKLAAANIISRSALHDETQQSALICEFSYDAKVLGETEHFLFTKRYSAETLMNYAIKLKEDE